MKKDSYMLSGFLPIHREHNEDADMTPSGLPLPAQLESSSLQHKARLVGVPLLGITILHHHVHVGHMSGCEGGRRTIDQGSLHQHQLSA